MNPAESGLAAVASVALLAVALLVLGGVWCAALAPRAALAVLRRRPAASLRRAASSVSAWALAFVAGLVLFHLLLSALQGASVPWSRTSMAAAVVLATGAALTLAAARANRTTADPLPEASVSVRWTAAWGGGVAVVAVAAFAGAVFTRTVTLPDFIYHWGLKGKRFHLANGVDYSFLSDPLGLTEHPDYPNLIPSLYAATAHVRGYFDELAMLAWSVLFLAVLLIFARAALGRRLSGVALEAGTALVALVTAMFATGYQLAGGADLLICAGVFLAAPALMRGGRPEPGATAWDDLRVGLAAALVATAKIEGIPLAALLIGGRLWVVGPRQLWTRLVPLVVPAATVVTTWAATVVVHDLTREANAGLVDPQRLAPVLTALGEALRTPEWYGFAASILGLPWMLTRRGLRPLAAVLLVQVSFYLYIYLSAVADPRFYVLSSFPRLLIHLVPPTLVLLWIRLAGDDAATAPAAGAGRRRSRPAVAGWLLAGLLTASLVACAPEDPAPILRYDDLVTAWFPSQAEDAPKAQVECADASPFSRPLPGGRELVLEVDLGLDPELVLSFCRLGKARGELRIRAEALAVEGEAEPATFTEELIVRGGERWQAHRLGLSALRRHLPEGAATDTVPVRLTLRSGLPAGVDLRLEEAYVRHRAPLAAGWPRRGVFVEGGLGAEIPESVAASALDATAGEETVSNPDGVSGQAGASGEAEPGLAEGPAQADSPNRSATAATPDTPHVLLISLDTLRADMLDAKAEGGGPLMPNLHRLAREGQRFHPHYASASWTKPSHASLLTGYPRTVHLLDGNEDELPAFLPTLAERLRAGGYATGGLVHNCVWLNPKFGFHRGFDDYRSVGWETGQLRRGAFNWMAERWQSEPRRPFFFFLHSFEAHSDFARLPYEALGTRTGDVEERFGVPRYGCREEHCSSALLGAIHDGEIEALPREDEILSYLYRAGVAETDAELGRLFDDLRDLGIWDDLLVIVTSDHGEMLLEHGATLHGRVWNEVLQVPLVVKWPRREGMPEPGPVSIPTSSVDVASTVVALAGLDPEELPGFDLRRPRRDRPIYTGSLYWHVLVNDGFKMLQKPQETDLFYLPDDPGEESSVAAEHPEVLRHLRGVKRDLFAWSESLRERLRRTHGGGESGDGSAPAADLTPEEEERLRALGYLR